MLESIKRTDLIEISRAQYSSYGLARSSIVNLLSVIRTLVKYMEKRDITEYNQDVGNEYLEWQRKRGRTVGTMRGQQRAIFLLQLKMEGKPYATMARRVEYQFPGELGHIAEQYIQDYASSRRLAKPSVVDIRRSLSRFCTAMEIEKVSLNNLSLDIVKRFFASTQNQTEDNVNYIRRFMNYLSEDFGVDKSIFNWLSNYKFRKNKPMPSVYTQTEIAMLEASYSRKSAVDKRNYAMVLLASRLGLRSSDITNLKFSDIDWEHNVIRLEQYKTKQPIELPLLKDVGEALIDYIVNGRKKCDIPYIFLTVMAPYKKLDPAAAGHTVHAHFIKAGVDISNRKSGAHALRHSLATKLLSSGTKLPVISEILGHTTSESTHYYLGVDLKLLQGCSHEVPVIPSAFYEQKDGVFYE